MAGVGYHLRWDGSFRHVRYLVAAEQTTGHLSPNKQREKKGDDAGARDDEASGE